QFLRLGMGGRLAEIELRGNGVSRGNGWDSRLRRHYHGRFGGRLLLRRRFRLGFGILTAGAKYRHDSEKRKPQCLFYHDFLNSLEFWSTRRRALPGPR